MSAARPLLPIDVIALVSYEGKVYPNQAMPWERLGKGQGPHPLEAALEQWFSFTAGRHTWVSLRGQTVRGLISARQRGQKHTWEIDCLIAAEEGICRELLNRLCQEATSGGVERVFLRLAEDGELLDPVQEAGFQAYVHEELWAWPGLPQPKDPGGLALRPRTREDLLPLFQLYNATAPAKVRCIEGTTLRQWWANRELGRGPGRPRELVMEQEGRITAWLLLTADDDLGRFSFLAHPTAHEKIGPLINTALARLARKKLVVALVPEHMAWATEALAGAGFGPAGRYTALVRPILQPALAHQRPSMRYHALPAP